MNRIVGCVTLALAFLSFSFIEKEINSLPIGSTLPKTELKIKDISGKEITLPDAKKENGLLVMFSCNTCPYVINNQSRTKEICRYAIEKKIGVILLNANEGGRDYGESFSDMQSYGKEQQYEWYYAIDSKSVLADAFGANRTPECFLFDKNNKLVYHGAIDDSPADITQVKRHHLKEAINEIIEGKEVTVKESRSVGCSINRIL
ncbi:MAG: redoxin domain-containing protein [Bacteroidetes bacterium]|nr:redoxin domain-containing protein [Bacteroidota bacterium]